MSLAHYTFGVEEEFLWVPGQSKAGAAPLFELWEHSKPESFQVTREAHANVVEISSKILPTLKDVAQHILLSRHWLRKQAEDVGASIFAGGTHPELDWQEMPLTEMPYYQKTLNEYQAALRSNFIFGLYTHIGGITKHQFPRVHNSMRCYLSILIALASNSSHWNGADTGLSCFRLATFGRLPRTGTPPPMSTVDNWMDELHQRVRSKSIMTPTQVWHDVRYHPTFHTMEIRAMDMQAQPEVSAMVATFAMALAMHLDMFGDALPAWHLPEWVIEENRWRAIRRGTSAMLLNELGEEVHVTELLGLLRERLGAFFIDLPIWFQSSLDNVIRKSREVAA